MTKKVLFGALTRKQYMFIQRPWELETRAFTLPWTNIAFNLQVRGNTLIRCLSPSNQLLSDKLHNFIMDISKEVSAGHTISIGKINTVISTKRMSRIFGYIFRHLRAFMKYNSMFRVFAKGFSTHSYEYYQHENQVYFGTLSFAFVDFEYLVYFKEAFNYLGTVGNIVPSASVVSESFGFYLNSVGSISSTENIPLFFLNCDLRMENLEFYNLRKKKNIHYFFKNINLNNKDFINVGYSAPKLYNFILKFIYPLYTNTNRQTATTKNFSLLRLVWTDNNLKIIERLLGSLYDRTFRFEVFNYQNSYFSFAKHFINFSHGEGNSTIINSTYNRFRFFWLLDRKETLSILESRNTLLMFWPFEPNRLDLVKVFGSNKPTILFFNHPSCLYKYNKSFSDYILKVELGIFGSAASTSPEINKAFSGRKRSPYSIYLNIKNRLYLNRSY
jgi:hypothetical protein